MHSLEGGIGFLRRGEGRKKPPLLRDFRECDTGMITNREKYEEWTQFLDMMNWAYYLRNREEIMERKKSKKSPAQRAEGRKNGKIKEFRLYAPDAKEAYLAGEFNSWDTRSYPMRKDKKGLWKKRIKLPFGRYEYKFFVDGDWVHDVPDTERTSNPFGTENFIINVQ